eukprot:TRINITY_DN100555_c0_g1_i1.p1 TRINITY_DN100555_c0_g1~~TRINITY_DN100555_c0_g1_i1.p1  ORF type:complete len:830 (+),score=287.97 TRINITY_DN100555_c0_g1_i1:83-2491(+)
MAPKAKKAAAADKPADEPAAKKAKTEEADEAKDVDMAKDAKQAEVEEDAKKDTRPVIKETVGFEASDTTLNVLVTTGGRVLSALSDGGMQYLVAGARANVGVSAGRYFYEVRVIEALNPIEGFNRNRSPAPRQLARIGFSVAGSSLLLGDGTGSAFFDSEGIYIADGKREASLQRLNRDQYLGLLLNLDESSPNANTISLFRNGERITQPMKLPESMKGKLLFPHVSYRNVTLQVHFGPAPLKPLPFVCRMFGGAAQKDATVTKPAVPKDGKYEVLFPVGLPDEATFDWLDGFLEKHPEYTELSDRKIIDWAVKSGLPKNRSQGRKTSNDKPDFNFGIALLEDFSVRRLLNAVTPFMARNYVVMEVKQNLLTADRSSNLKKFSSPLFKKVAHVVVGEPNQEYQKKVHDQLLSEKTSKAKLVWSAKQLEKNRKRELEKRQKEAEEKRLAATKKAEEEKKEAAAKKEGADENAEAKAEEVKEEAKEDVKEEVKEEEDEEMPPVELTDEEKKVMFRTSQIPDLAPNVLAASFADFTIPAKEEGFDEVRFEWRDSKKSEEYLRSYVVDRKKTMRLEDLKFGEWFQTKLSEWTNQLSAMKAKQAESKGKVQDKKDDDEEKAVDIFSAEDINDVGSGIPLYAAFGMEDWQLVTTRVELHLLAHAYKKELDDPDRPTIHESNLAFYYGKFFKKQLAPTFFGKDTFKELCELVKEAASIDGNQMLIAAQGDDFNFDQFVKHTEDIRRDRQRRLDAGDETARLKIQPLPSAFVPERRPTDKAGNKGPVDKGFGKGPPGKGGRRQWQQGKGY